MKKILLSSVTLVGLTAGALAADLPSRRAPAPYVAVPVFTWTGFYVGANAGYGFSTGSDRAFGQAGNLFAPAFPGAAVNAVGPAGTAFATGSRGSRDGFVGGGQVGYNYQVGSFVFGVEGDIQYTDFGNRRNTTFGTATPVAGVIAPVAAGAPGNVAFFSRGNNSDFYGTARARVGYAVDRTLFYVSGGAAFRDTSNNQQSVFGFSNLVPRKGDTVGYTAGGGVEYAFTPNITGRVEGYYVNFGDRGRVNGGSLVGVTNLNAPIVAVTGNRRDDDFVVVRAGINYKFTSY